MSIKLTSDDINFEKATPVISNAQKFVLPIPAFADGGEPLVYPKDHEQAGQPIADWEGKPIGDNGVVFFNAKDQAVQAVPGDGTGVIIMNEVTEEQGAKLEAFIERTLRTLPARSHAGLYAPVDSAEYKDAQIDLAFAENSTVNNLTHSEVKSILNYAQNELGIGDMYNSDKGFIASKMNPLEKSSTGVEAYGLHRRDDRDICQAVFVPGEGEFQGPAATPQKFQDGAVILKQGDDTRLIQPAEFERTYTNPDGSALSRDSLQQQSAGKEANRGADKSDWQKAVDRVVQTDDTVKGLGKQLRESGVRNVTPPPSQGQKPKGPDGVGGPG